MANKKPDPRQQTIYVPFTARFVDEATALPGSERSRFWDAHKDAPPGFCMRVRETGARAFYIEGRVKGGAAVSVRIGEARGRWLEEARKVGWEFYGELQRGLNPNEQRRARARHERAEQLARVSGVDEWTVAGMVRAYLKTRIEGGGLAAATVRNYERQAKYIEATTLGAMVAREVVRNDVRSLVGRKAEVHPHMAAALLSLLQAAYRWASTEEVLVELPDGKRTARARVDRDPTRGILADLPKVRAAARKRRARVLTDGEIVTFWEELDKLELCWASLPRIILLCGTRRGETYAARWENVHLDGDAPYWHIPAADRKGRVEGSAGARRALDIPLPPFAVRQFRGLQAVTGRQERVFVGQGISLGHVGGEVKRVTGLKDLWLHDLRRSTATGLQRLGAPPHVISVVLGHAREAGATGPDAHYTHDRRGGEHRTWLDAWAAHVEGLVGGRHQNGPVDSGE